MGNGCWMGMEFNSGRRKMSGDAWWCLSRYTRGLTAPSLPLKMTINIQHNPDTYGSRNISEEEASKSQRIWRDAVRCCLLNMTWLSHSWTHKRWGYLSKTSHKIKSSKVLVYGRSVLQALAFTKGLLRVDIYWRRIILFKWCGHWQIPHVAGDNSMPVHVWGALI